MWIVTESFKLEEEHSDCATTESKVSSAIWSGSNLMQTELVVTGISETIAGVLIVAHEFGLALWHETCAIACGGGGTCGGGGGVSVFLGLAGTLMRRLLVRIGRTFALDCVCMFLSRTINLCIYTIEL